MSRRVVSADKAAQNTATLKQLVKLEGNKSCADCKKNKHPRWASWNLGIFVCIRCSGIHRGMGTHISRVKSVDLDAWTDEQLQSMIKWGNSKANKYWEAKLAPGHVPAEAKIENFIRTKYDSKRWVMEGPMPDPSTLGDGADDDVPLSVVQEKAKMDRASSVRNAQSPALVAARRAGNNIDLFGDEPAQPARPSTTEPVPSARPPPIRAPAAPSAPTTQAKQNKPAESLLGLDFFGGTKSAPPARPASATALGSSGLPQRTDLKQSILSLYASTPKPAPAPTQSAPQSNVQQGRSQATSSTLDDAFSSLSFGAPAPAPIQSAPFQSQPPAPRPTPAAAAGGSFFDTKPTSTSFAAPAKPAAPRQSGGFNDWGDFTSAASPPPLPTNTAPPATSSMGDMFDWSDPAPAPAPVARAAPAPAAPASKPPPAINMSSYTSNSAFNLSTPAPAPATQPKAPASTTNFSAMSGMDAWGSDNAWSTPDPEPARPAPPQTSTAPSTYKAPATTAVSSSALTDDFGGWGSNDNATPAKPIVTQDDDFGGWSSASPVAAPAAPRQTTTTTTSKPSAPAQAKPFSSGGDDLFGNVWE